MINTINIIGIIVSTIKRNIYTGHFSYQWMLIPSNKLIVLIFSFPKKQVLIPFSFHPNILFCNFCSYISYCTTKKRYRRVHHFLGSPVTSPVITETTCLTANESNLCIHIKEPREIKFEQNNHKSSLLLALKYLKNHK